MPIIINRPEVNFPGFCSLFIIPAKHAQIIPSDDGFKLLVADEVSDDAVEMYYTKQTLSVNDGAATTEQGTVFGTELSFSFPGFRLMNSFVKQWHGQDQVIYWEDMDGNSHVLGEVENGCRLKSAFQHENNRKNWTITFSYNGTYGIRPVGFADLNYIA